MSEQGQLQAEEAGLVYVEDGGPGFSRRRCGRGFVYLDAAGKPVRDPATVGRLRSLVVPPAWTEVWYCVDPAGHIQATGRDAKGRKQYRYHDDWSRARDDAKFESLVGFGHQLTPLRQRVADDMARRSLDRDRVVATTIWLLDRTLIRVGNEEYARDGSSYGLTTLLDEHVDVGATRLVFHFVGKSGKVHEVTLADRRVATTVGRCQDLPGQHLLQYLDDDGQPRSITSRDVNDYLRDTTDAPYTAKTFRTWGGSVHAYRRLLVTGPPPTVREAKRQITAAITETARELRNTPAVCRRSYVHPRILDAHLDGSLHQRPPSRRRGSNGNGAGAKRRGEKGESRLLTPDEVDLLDFLS